MIKISIAIAILVTSYPVSAFDLFGVNVTSSTIDQLRIVIREVGAISLQEGNDTDWFDVYDSQALIEGSTILYLGYIKSNGQFAFAEYEFAGLKQSSLVSKLKQKYGKPVVKKGNFVSDQQLIWQADRIQITFSVDWSNYKSRLSYIDPLALDAYRNEQKRALESQVIETGKQNFSTY